MLVIKVSAKRCIDYWNTSVITSALITGGVGRHALLNFKTSWEVLLNKHSSEAATMSLIQCCATAVITSALITGGVGCHALLNFKTSWEVLLSKRSSEAATMSLI